jgi:bifunctional ADP-heptose synthase (sugar kinase/adenylyltransferase)
MESKVRTEKWSARSAGQPLISQWQPVFSRRCTSLESLATIFQKMTLPFFAAAASIAKGWCVPNERVTLVTDLNVFADFKPRLPEKYRASKYVFLANIAPDLQRDVLHQVKKRPKIAALDTMNYWIERTNKDLLETLRHVDILMINDAETRQLSSEHNLLRAAKRIFKMGPSTLVVKRGEYGAMLVDNRGVFCVPAFPLEEPHDPTGAGDSFAGGFMGHLAAEGSKSDAALRRAMVYGSVMGSFTVEKFGLDRLRILKHREIHARARHFAKLTQFTL